VPRLLAVALTLGALLWSAIIVLAPVALTHGSPRVSFASALVYEGAGLICHQRPERSFHLAGAQLPVCGRCAGLYLSGTAGALLAWVGWRQKAEPRHVRLAILAAAVPTALTVGVEWLSLASPSNTIRAVSAIPLGAAAGWIFVQALRTEGRDGRRQAAGGKRQEIAAPSDAL